MNLTGRAVPADERLKRAHEALASAIALVEPHGDSRAHGAWVVKRRAWLKRAEKELRAAKRQNADPRACRLIEIEIQRVFNATRLLASRD